MDVHEASCAVPRGTHRDCRRVERLVLNQSSKRCDILGEGAQNAHLRMFRIALRESLVVREPKATSGDLRYAVDDRIGVASVPKVIQTAAGVVDHVQRMLIVSQYIRDVVLWR